MLLAGDAALQPAAPAPRVLATESVVMVSGVESLVVPSGAGAAVGARVAAASAALEGGRRLLLAARAGDTAQVRALLAAGAPFTADWLGTSPLHLAAANNHLETAEVLLRAGVSRDARTKVERTPLHLAACAGHAAVVSALLTHGANVDCRDMLGMTPLHWAAERGHAAAARALLAAGADPAARCRFRRTPRALAARDPALLALFDAELAARERRQRERPPDPPRQPDPPDQQLRQYKAHKHQKENTAEQITNIVFETEEVKPQKTPEKKPIKYKLVQNEKFFKTDTNASAGAAADSSGSAAGGGGGGGGSPAALLLRRHGITLLPHDPTGTVLSALQCGRTVVLSDAGKLMLAESEAPGPRAPEGPPPPEEAPAAPAPGPARVLRKVDPVQFQKVKLIQMSEGGAGGGRAASPLRPVRLKLRARGGGGGRQVRLVLGRAGLQRLVAGAGGAAAAAAAQPEVKSSSEEEQDSSSAGAGGEVGRLRAQLAAARATIAQLRRQLAARAPQ